MVLLMAWPLPSNSYEMEKLPGFLGRQEQASPEGWSKLATSTCQSVHMGQERVLWSNTHFETGAGNLQTTRTIRPKIKQTQRNFFFPRNPGGTSSWISGERVAPDCSLHWECEYKYLTALCSGEIGQLISSKRRPVKLPEWNWNITYTYKVFWIYCHSETLIYTQYLDATFTCYTFNASCTTLLMIEQWYTNK